MKICIIGKVPPIQGGVSNHVLWIAYYLAEAGHEVHIVTNAQEVETDFRFFNLDYKLEDCSLKSPLDHENIHVHNSLSDKHQVYIPQANPFVSKMASMATNVINQHGCTVIFSYYFEPYCVAAYLASQWTNTPFFITHAGSDVGRLIKSPYLSTTYKEVLKSCHGIISSDKLIPMFIKENIDLSKVVLSRKHVEIVHFKKEHYPKFDFNRYIEHVKNHASDHLKENYSTFPNKDIDQSIPIIGAYGKSGRYKGHIELIKSLGIAKKKGAKFQLVFLTQGRPEIFENLRREIVNDGIEEDVWILPFIAPWQVPSFIKSCSLVAFLEHNFPIKIHMPGVPQQALACGAPLLVSSEIMIKQSFSDKMKHMENCIIVRPDQTEEFADTLLEVLSDTKRLEQMGPEGFKLVADSTTKEEAIAHVDELFDLMNEKSVKMKELQDLKKNLYFANNYGEAASGELLYKINERHVSLFKEIYSGMLKSYFPLTNSIFSETIQGDFDNYLSRGTDLTSTELIEGFYAYMLKKAPSEKEPSLLKDTLTVDVLSYRCVKSRVLRADKEEVPELTGEHKPNLDPSVCLVAVEHNLMPNLDLVVKEVEKRKSYLLFKPRSTFYDTGIQELNKDAYQLLMQLDGAVTLNEIIDEHPVYKKNKKLCLNFVKQLAKKNMLEELEELSVIK